MADSVAEGAEKPHASLTVPPLPGVVVLADEEEHMPHSPMSNDKDNKSAATDAPIPIPFIQLYRGMDWLDVLFVVVGSMGALAGGAMMPLFTTLFGSFINSFGHPDSNFMGVITDLSLKFTYLAIGAACSMYLEVALLMLSGNRQTNRLRQLYLQAVLRQDVAFFDTAASAGGLLQGLNEDSQAVQAAISEKASNFLHNMATFLVGFLVSFAYSWDMTLVMLGLLPFLAFMGYVLMRATRIQAEANTQAYADAGTVAQQALASIRTVAAYNSQDAVMQAYTQALAGPLKTGVKTGIMQGLSLGGIQFIMFSSFAIAFFYGSHRIAAGAYDGGQIVVVMFSTLLGGLSLGQAAPNLQDFARGRMAGARMFKVIERVPGIVDVGAAAAPASKPSGKGGSPVDEDAGPVVAANGNGELPEVRGDLELRDISFAYPARPDVLVFSSFSLTIPAGKTVALVGSSGSGKSTAVQLIERFYDPLSGVVLLDGVDLRALSMAWLRQHVGLVSQEPTLFATTIYENIAIGRPGCTEEEVVEAAKAANAHRFVSSLPEGYQTQVGERGVQMSGGQKQRIAIARAILKNPKVLLLDEATSALDTQSERLVQAALDRMVVGRTTVVVAHRLSTIKHADAIAVVGGGQVQELGSHEQLLANPTGAYTNLVKLQMQHTDVEPGKANAAAGEQGEAKGKGEGASLEELEEQEVQATVQAVGAMALVMNAPLSTATSAPAPVSSTGPVSRISLQLEPRDGPAVEGQGAAGKAQRTSIDLGGASGKPRGTVLTDKQKEAEQTKLDEAAGKQVPYWRLLALSRPEWPSLVMGVLASGVAGCQQPAFALVMSSMILIFYLPDTDEMLRKASFYAGMFVVIAGGVAITLLMQQAFLTHAAQHLSQRVRLMLLKQLLYQDVGFFDQDVNSSGRLTSALSTDAGYIRGALGDSAGLALQCVTTLSFGYAIALAYDWQLALVITGALPLLIASMYQRTRMAAGASNQTDKLYAGANQHITEAFTSIRVIHAYNLQSYISGTYAAMLADADAVTRRDAHLGGIAMGCAYFCQFALYGLVIYFGGWQVSQGLVDFNGMFKGFLAVLLAATGIARAGASFPDLGKAKAAVGRVFPILDRKPAIDAASPDGLKPPNASVRGEVEFQHVAFYYPNRPSVVVYKDFCLHVPAGKVCALVGESGSGKSTVVSLLERFYDPTAGTILFDRVDIRQLNIKWLRSQLGLVSQEPVLFAGSIEHNIRYGKPDASAEEVEAAAAVANASEFIAKLPEGMNTLVGEGGIQLSGGQKQRIAIARAVVKDPKVMLLDEATSALDARSERVVQAALDRIMAGRTCIVIAHRLTTIRDAHAINVVYRGVILEQGTHDELLKLQDGAYARLVAAQHQAHGA